MSPTGLGERSLKIAIFGIRTIPSTYSGYETFCNVLLPELVRRGHDVTLYTREPYGQREEYQGVKKFGLPSLPTKQFDTLSHSFVSAMKSRVDRPDVALVFNVANAPALTVLTKTGVPTVLNVDGQEWRRGKWGSAAKRVFYECARMAKHTASTLITDCEAMAEIYRKDFSSDSTVIPYCWTGLIDEDERVSADDDYLGTLGLENRKYLVTGGRLIPENHIAEITRSHTRTDLDVPIAVLGAANYDSPVQRELKEMAAADPRVRLLGHIDDRHGFGVLLRDAAVYLHGHSVGGINPSIVEAMGVGALIAANDTPFNREAAGDVAFYFGDPENAVAEAQRFIESDVAESKRLAGIERVNEHYSLGHIVDLYERALYDAVAK